MPLVETSASGSSCALGPSGQAVCDSALAGRVAVLVTGVLGYMRARDALQETIYNQLTATRKSQGAPGRNLLPHHPQRAAPARQLEDGGRRHARLPRRRRRARSADVPPDIRRKVADWYNADYLPEMRRALGRSRTSTTTCRSDRPPTTSNTATSSPIPIRGAAQAARRCRRRQRLQRLHAIYHPLLRRAAATLGFSDLMLADSQDRPHL